MATIYVDENKNIHALGSIIDSLPVGSIVLWPSNTAPAGWFVCNGDAVSRTKYKDLFSVVGISYGPGDNSTTFNLPDFRGRTPVGVNDGTGSVSETFSLANSGGEVTHTLTEDEMPSHNHNLYTYDGANPSSTARKVRGTENAQVAAYTNGGTEYRGGGQAHNNMQPYLVVNYIIKAFYNVSASGGQGGGDASSDIIIIGQESDVTEDTKLLVEPEDLEPNGSEVVNTLENNESTKAPSVRAVNQALSSLRRVYSEEETIIGTWFGKPLYARTVIYTPGRAVSDLQVPLGDTTMTFVRPVEISCIRPNGICVNIDWFDRQSGAHTNLYIDGQRRLRGEATVDDLTQSTWYIYLEYIKDTDVFVVGQNYAGKTMSMTFPNNTTFTNYLYNLAGGEQPEATIVSFGNSAIMTNVGAAAGTVYYDLSFYPDTSDKTNRTTLYSATYTNESGTWNYGTNLASFTLPASLSNCTSVNSDTNATNIIKYITIS